MKNKNKTKSEIEVLNAELKTLPEGHLNRKGKFYYRTINRKDIGITRNKALIQTLYRKKYVLARIVQLQSSLSKSIVEFNDTTALDLIRTFSKTYQDIPLSYFYHSSVEAWMSKERQENSYSIKRSFRTLRDKVLLRSKSEYIIASLLEEHGILYRHAVVPFGLSPQG